MDSKADKNDLKKIAKEILSESFADKTTGKTLTGAEILKQGLITNIANPNGKNWAKAIVLMRELIGEDDDDEDDEL